MLQTRTSVWRGGGGNRGISGNAQEKAFFSQENVPNNINEICVVIFSRQGHINQVSTRGVTQQLTGKVMMIGSEKNEEDAKLD